MPADVVWHRQARADLTDIAAFLESRNPSAARRFVEHVDRKVTHLAWFPKIGARRDDLRSSVRTLTEKPYVIVYRAVPDTDGDDVRRVEVLRVVDGRRDLPRLFARPRARR